MGALLKIHDWHRVRELRGAEKREATRIIFYLFSRNLLTGDDVSDYICSVGFSRIVANAVTTFHASLTDA